MKRVILGLILALAVLPAVAAAPSAQAGTGSPQECTGQSYGFPGAGLPEYHWNRWYIPIIQSPVMLGLELSIANGSNFTIGGQLFHAALCYSTSPYGYGQQDTTGGRIEVNIDDTYRYDSPDWNSVSCQPQSNQSALATSCYVTDDGAAVCTFVCASASTTPWVDLVEDGTVRFAVPITVCAPSCTSTSPGLGSTGVVLLTGQTSLTSPPAGTSTGAGVTTLPVQSLAVCANGNCQSLLSSGPQVIAGLGFNASSVGTGTGGACTVPWSLGCYAAYGVYATYHGAPVATLQIGSTVVPVTLPLAPGCYGNTDSPDCRTVDW